MADDTDTMPLPSDETSPITPGQPKSERPSAGLQASGSARPVTEFAGYRIQSELGRGGMGVVYKAFDAKLKRSVALKVLLNAEHASEEEIQRFFREAESAAKLQHPNIVSIHDLQVHEGKHYYTMDYIDGEPLDALIEELRPDARQTCELLEKVARGLEVAHEQGIIHRDLKPANIIVAPDGEPKVTDFGLAKVLTSPEEKMIRAGLTGSGVAMGTPHYEAPEQASGMSSEVDARTDVYALGCILYELLAGMPPFEAASAMEVLRMQVEEDPVPPSKRGARIPADVETICLKCLEKEPGRRYQSAAALAEDLRRFLDGDPVSARRASIIYVTRKKLIRHKVVLSVVAVAFAALLGTAVWSYVRIVRERDAAILSRKSEETHRRTADKKHREAERERKRAEAVNDFLTDMLATAHPTRRAGRKVTVLSVMDSMSNRVARRFKDDPRTQQSLHATIGNVYMGLGQYEKAERHLTQARSLGKDLFGERHAEYATSLDDLAGLYCRRGRYAEAEPLYIKAINIRREVLGEKDVLYAAGLNNLASLYNARGQYAKAEPLYVRAMETVKKALGEKHPLYAKGLNNLATLYDIQGRYAKAEPLLVEAMEIRKATLGEKHSDYAWSLSNLGGVYFKQGRLAEAEPLFVKAAAIRKEILGEKHPEYATSLEWLAGLNYRRARYAKAETFYVSALKIRKEVLGEKHPRYAASLHNLAALYYVQGQYAKAEPLYAESVEIMRSALGEKHVDYALSLNELGKVRFARGRYSSAKSLWSKALPILRRTLGASHKSTREVEQSLKNVRGKLKEQGLKQK